MLTPVPPAGVAPVPPVAVLPPVVNPVVPVVPVAPPVAAPPRDCGLGADDPGCGIAKGGQLPLPGEEFKPLFDVLRGEPNELVRKDMLDTSVKGLLTARQYGKLLGLFRNEITKFEVASELAPKVVNPKAAMVLASEFKNAFHKRDFVELISNQ